MAVPSVNNVQSSRTTATSGTSFSIGTYVPSSGANGKLVVGVGIKENDLTWAVSGVTYAGTAMTAVNDDVHDVTTSRVRGSLWYMDDPLGKAASGAIVVTLDTSLTYDVVHIIAATLLGAAQDAPTAGEKATTNNGSSPHSVSVTPGEDDSVVVSLMMTSSVGATIEPTSPMTEDLQIADSGDLATSFGHIDVTTATATTVEWTVSSGNRRVLVAASFGPAAATTGTVAQTAPVATQDISGAETFTGTVGQTAPVAQQAITGTAIQDATGTVAQTAPVAEQAITGAETFTGTIAQQAAAAAQDITGSTVNTGTVAQIAPAAAQEIAGAESFTGTIAQAAAIPTQAIAGELTISGIIAQAAIIPSQAISGTATAFMTGTIAQTIAIPVQALSGTSAWIGTVVAGKHGHRVKIRA